MKNRLSILILLLSITLLTTIKLSAQDKNSALEYNDKMIAIQTSVDDALAKFVDALDAFDPDLMAKEKKNALQTIKKANKDIAAMGKFDGKDDYIKEMKIFMKMYKEITSKDLSEIMNLIIKKGEDFSETDWDTYDSYFEQYPIKCVS